MRRITTITVRTLGTRCNERLPVTALIRAHRDRYGFTACHYYVTRRGTVYQTRHEQLPGVEALGDHAHALVVGCEGGLDASGHPADTRTPRQRQSLGRLLRRLAAAHPGACVDSQLL